MAPRSNRGIRGALRLVAPDRTRRGAAARSLARLVDPAYPRWLSQRVTEWGATRHTPGDRSGDGRVDHRAGTASRPVVLSLKGGAASLNTAVGILDAVTPVVVLGPGDRLEPWAIDRISDRFAGDPDLVMVSWDDDVAGRWDPRFRPEWSPELLLSWPYLGRAFAVRAGAWTASGGLRSDDASGWWDLSLRLDLIAGGTARIPEVLVHLGRPRPHLDPRAALTVVDSELARRGWPARPRRHRGVVHLDWQLATWPSVTVVVPTPHNEGLLARLLPTLAATDYPDLEVLVVDNGPRTPAHVGWYEQWSTTLDVKVVWQEADADRPFNYSVANNTGAAVGRGEVLVFLNDDCECPDPAWLRELVGWATRPEVGTVGPLLVGADGLVQHGGVVMGLNGLAEHAFAHMPPGSDSLIGPTDAIRNSSALTGACLAIRRSLFEEVGGFDESFRLIGSDIALSLETRRLGLRTVMSPAHPVLHLESATRGSYRVDADARRCWEVFREEILRGDRYWSPNLSLVGGHRPRLSDPEEPTPWDLLEGHFGHPVL